MRHHFQALKKYPHLFLTRFVVSVQRLTHQFFLNTGNHSSISHDIFKFKYTYPYQTSDHPGMPPARDQLLRIKPNTPPDRRLRTIFKLSYTFPAIRRSALSRPPSTDCSCSKKSTPRSHRAVVGQESQIQQYHCTPHRPQPITAGTLEPFRQLPPEGFLPRAGASQGSLDSRVHLHGV